VTNELNESVCWSTQHSAYR